MAPLVVASPSYLSLTWFPENERNFATAIANVASALGRAIGFFLGPGKWTEEHVTHNLTAPLYSSRAFAAAVTPPHPPYWRSHIFSLLLFSTIIVVAHTPGLVPNDDPAHLPLLLYVEIGLALLPVVCVAIYYPDHPPAPPSAAAAAARSPATLSRQASQGFGASLAHTLLEFSTACSHPAFILLALAGGLQMGVYGAWSGVLTVVMSNHFGTSKVGECSLFQRALLPCVVRFPTSQPLHFERCPRNSLA